MAGGTKSAETVPWMSSPQRRHKRSKPRKRRCGGESASSLPVSKTNAAYCMSTKDVQDLSGAGSTTRWLREQVLDSGLGWHKGMGAAQRRRGGGTENSEAAHGMWRNTGGCWLAKKQHMNTTQGSGAALDAQENEVLEPKWLRNANFFPSTTTVKFRERRRPRQAPASGSPHGLGEPQWATWKRSAGIGQPPPHRRARATGRKEHIAPPGSEPMRAQEAEPATAGSGQRG